MSELRPWQSWERPNEAGLFQGRAGHVAQHGTNSGYIRHRQARQEACDACKKAHAAYNLSRRVARLEVTS